MTLCIAAVAPPQRSASIVLKSRHVGVPGDLGDLFCAHARGSVASRSELTELLNATVADARQTWPTIAIEPERFVAFLAERVPAGEDACDALAAMYGSDLYLVCGLIAGDRQALQAFDRILPERVARFIRKIESSPQIADEITQAVRIKLLVPSADGGPPRIAQYSGCHSLDSWLCTVAIRALLEQRRVRRLDMIDESVEVLAASDDPELELLRARYGNACTQALGEACATLDLRQRRLLQLYYGRGYTFEQLGWLFQVNQTTARAWVVRARTQLVDAARASLRQQLGVSSGELDQLMQLMQSRLDVSLGCILDSRSEVER
jgi:RNA polymerase sigma-70 factor